jgi:phosphatidylserine decarboxylase
MKRSFQFTLLLSLLLLVLLPGRTVLAEEPAALPPVVEELKELIESDAQLYMLFTEMFEQVPPEYQDDPTGKRQIRDYHQMLQILSRTLTTSPEFNETGLVGFPINAVLDWPMGTAAGQTAFLDPRVNRQLKKILSAWGDFLQSPKSRYVLSDDPKSGWFGRDAQKAMPGFADDFICQPKEPYYGFASWDDFFTRRFREGRRPVAGVDDPSVIANACESAPYRLAKNVKLLDKFWLKSQPYSLQHMLAMDPLAEQFDGGTVYQAFLSALSYHRWHSPVSGTIVKTQLIDGSYYAEAASEGFDPAGPNNSQGYITQVAARGLVFIEADNPDIGLMAVLFVGMAEVSSNDFTVSPGQHVDKGDELGMFHFGGSTHCLIFRPGVQLKFDLRGQTPGVHSENIPVRSRIATVGGLAPH